MLGIFSETVIVRKEINMTDFEKWEKWLKQWDVKCGVVEYDDFRERPTIELTVYGCDACTSVVFDAETREFMYLTAQNN